MSRAHPARHVWPFGSNSSGNSKVAGQGDHSAVAADTDGDVAQVVPPEPDVFVK